jgi:hypothetical protein
MRHKQFKKSKHFARRMDEEQIAEMRDRKNRRRKEWLREFLMDQKELLQSQRER